MTLDLTQGTPWKGALRFALPLYLLRQTGSAALYGGITALAMLPALAGMLTGGALADRCRKARLMALLDLVTAGISVAAAAGLPHLPLLPLILAVLGSLYAIQGLYQPVVRNCRCWCRRHSWARQPPASPCWPA